MLAICALFRCKADIERERGRERERAFDKIISIDKPW